MNDFLRGAVRALGIVAGFFPIAISFGAIALQAGVSPLETLGMSVWIFAGASQFAVIEAIRQQLPWFSIVVTVLIINLRHLPMSLSIYDRYSKFGRWQHFVLCHGLVDETFALESSDPPRSFIYYLGMHLTCWLAWIAGTWVGCQFGAWVPDRWLAFALPALFVCLLVNSVRQSWSRAMLYLVAIGTALTVVTHSLGSTGMLISIIGIAIAASLLSPSNTPDAHSMEQSK